MKSGRGGSRLRLGQVQVPHRDKEALQAWHHKIGKAESPECRHCGKAAETGDHLVFVCEK